MRILAAKQPLEATRLRNDIHNKPTITNMQLRRFTADSTPAALGAVRTALGDDAIILANRRVGDQVEIIATGQMDDVSAIAELSIDEIQTENKKQKSKNNFNSKQDRPSFTLNSGNETDRLDGQTSAEDTGSGSSSLNSDNVRSLSTDSTLTADYNVEISDAKHVQMPNCIDTPIDINDDRNTELLKELQSGLLSDKRRTLNSEHAEVDSGRLLLAIEQQNERVNDQFRALAVNLWGNHSPNHSTHLQSLLSLGLGAELAVRLVERADPELPVDTALRHSLALLKSTIPIGVDKTFSSPGITVVSGPPGSGKTTALVKMAAQHVKENGTDSIVLICADTRRIGAFEELQAYGRILGIPAVHAHDTAELEGLVSAFTHKRLVLIDHTMPMAHDSVSLPSSLTNAYREDSVRHLFVLPAGMQSATVDALIGEHCTEYKMLCVLTHLDTTARFGEVLSATIRHHLPIAYWSDAASVQQPLRKADASVLVATAVAMSRRIKSNVDDQWLLRLIQPSHGLLGDQQPAGKVSRAKQL